MSFRVHRLGTRAFSSSSSVSSRVHISKKLRQCSASSVAPTFLATSCTAMAVGFVTHMPDNFRIRTRYKLSTSSSLAPMNISSRFVRWVSSTNHRQSSVWRN
eukprot:Blabericola_migrator_1__12823@NODE_828_length_6363_cov_61_035419_g585_i0_p5_GENE_NODE_828_length_6363_cov_61_035419_g585_i0NODE_828_length_6363_cov_61_035419_g585_i0_p5_ORF_typecomplete_len102_score2_86Cyt_c_ox_IV/PF12270_8/0_15_NODE_828_length_6363_cov_61_035419_g585_i018102115